MAATTVTVAAAAWGRGAMDEDRGTAARGASGASGAPGARWLWGAGPLPAGGGVAGAGRLMLLMAGNNAWANDRLLGACEALTDAEWRAPRTGPFPSIAATMSHLHWVDRFYLDALTGGGRGRAVYEDAPEPGREPAAADLRELQSGLDWGLCRFCATLPARGLSLPVSTDRGAAGAVPERVDALLLHVFQHAVHHRGQAHAMLAGTAVAPPQLDEFHLDFERHPGAARILGAASC